MIATLVSSTADKQERESFTRTIGLSRKKVTRKGLTQQISVIAGEKVGFIVKRKLNTILIATAAMTCLAATASHAAVLHDSADRAGPHYAASMEVDRNWPGTSGSVANFDSDILVRATVTNDLRDLKLARQSDSAVERISHHRLVPQPTTTQLPGDEGLQRSSAFAPVTRPGTGRNDLAPVNAAANLLDAMNLDAPAAGDRIDAPIAADATTKTFAKAIVPVSGAEPILLLGAMTLVLRRNTRHEHETH